MVATLEATKSRSLELLPTLPSQNIEAEFVRIRHFFYLKDRINRYGAVKRLFDLLFSATVLVTLAPFFLLVAIWIKMASPQGPVFFAQQRIGRNGQRFPCYKFRTMVPNAEQVLNKLFQDNPKLREEFLKDFKLKDDPRIIPGIGHLLRKTSLDELPQFFNVLLGHMAIVGPRPIVPHELMKYGKYSMYLFLLRPGITGPWQTGGRNDTSYRRRVAYDLHYIKTRTFWKDLYIVFKTVLVMLTKRGAY